MKKYDFFERIQELSVDLICVNHSFKGKYNDFAVFFCVSVMVHFPLVSITSCMLTGYWLDFCGCCSWFPMCTQRSSLLGVCRILCCVSKPLP